ncbi:phage protein Gp27 family protein [Vibrio sp. M260112]|uniref:phage protein Gp27 family protein n=1 Tax=Vibrio sp. M260112 TaxID=3020895 RepID=UPI002F3F157C
MKSLLSASESHELASLVRSIGVRNVLDILRRAASPKKNTRLYKFEQLPTDIRASVAVMLCSRRYTQKDILFYINNEIDRRNLKNNLKLSRSGFNRYLKEKILND